MDREVHAAALYRLGRPDEARPLIAELTAGGFARPELLQRARSAGG